MEFGRFNFGKYQLQTPLLGQAFENPNCWRAKSFEPPENSRRWGMRVLLAVRDVVAQGPWTKPGSTTSIVVAWTNA